MNSTGINVTGTVTADGLTVSNLDGSIVKLESTGTGLGAGAVIGDLQFYGNDASTPGAGIKASITATTVTALGDDSQLMFSTSNGTTNNVNRMLLANNGNLSLYEDTGTTPKFVWDASAESLGIGESAPSSKLVVGGNGASTLKPTVQITDGNNGASLALRGKSPILFLDATAGGVPKILMDSQGVEFKNGTIDSEGSVAVKIDSSDNLLVGVTSTTLTGGSLTLPNSGIIAFHDAGGAARNVLQFVSGNIKHGAAGSGVTTQSFYTDNTLAATID